MDVEKYLKQVGYISTREPHGEMWLSKFDDSYIVPVGCEIDVKYLADLEITGALTNGVGFSPKDNKWYGWSQWVMFGFTIGSTCEKGDYHYFADTPEGLIEEYIEFDKGCDERKNKYQILSDRSGIRVLPAPIKIPDMGISVGRVGGINGAPKNLLFRKSSYEVKCGKGEWIANTINDAKHMAQDFNRGAS